MLYMVLLPLWIPGFPFKAVNAAQQKRHAKLPFSAILLRCPMVFGRSWGRHSALQTRRAGSCYVTGVGGTQPITACCPVCLLNWGFMIWHQQLLPARFRHCSWLDYAKKPQRARKMPFLSSTRSPAPWERCLFCLSPLGFTAGGRRWKLENEGLWRAISVRPRCGVTWVLDGAKSRAKVLTRGAPRWPPGPCVSILLPPASGGRPEGQTQAWDFSGFCCCLLVWLFCVFLPKSSWKSGI